MEMTLAQPQSTYKEVPQANSMHTYKIYHLDVATCAKLGMCIINKAVYTAHYLYMCHDIICLAKWL